MGRKKKNFGLLSETERRRIDGLTLRELGELLATGVKGEVYRYAVKRYLQLKKRADQLTAVEVAINAAKEA